MVRRIQRDEKEIHEDAENQKPLKGARWYPHFLSVGVFVVAAFASLCSVQNRNGFRSSLRASKPIGGFLGLLLTEETREEICSHGDPAHKQNLLHGWPAR